MNAMCCGHDEVRSLQEQFSDATDAIHFTINAVDGEVNSTTSSSRHYYSCELVREAAPLGGGSSNGCLQSADGFTYRLYVDQTPIMEHAVDAALRVGLPGLPHTSTVPPPAPAQVPLDDQPPPSYDETVYVDNQLPPRYDD